MRVPQVSERVKEAPAQALRAMFAGIGQLLAASDKLRGKSATDEAAAEAKAAKGTFKDWKHGLDENLAALCARIGTKRALSPIMLT